MIIIHKNFISRGEFFFGLYFVESEPNYKNSNIFTLKCLLNISIKVEAPRNQLFDVCLVSCMGAVVTSARKCLGGWSMDYRLPHCVLYKNQGNRCAFCGGDYPDNYKRYCVYLEISERKNDNSFVIVLTLRKFPLTELTLLNALHYSKITW